MYAAIALLLVAAAPLSSAHFGLNYPEWRADSLTNESYSQWEYPCAGVPIGTGNRTDWPIGGGSVNLSLHHPWTYLFINLGLGENTTNFAYSLTPSLLNTTGNGTFCLPSLPIPAEANVTDGQKATIQVVSSGESGSALYNCADITFRASAQPLSGDQCQNSTGVTAAIVGQSATEGASPSTTPSAAGRTPVGQTMLALAIGLTTVALV
ncbi:hypothetical protein F4778DRAFT_747859 [Xylariomycetidae sp. FL2044]|nr:hypothetical protein F4778DRAFT_747859 [Xylariomycetidae sp. FL2044]